MAQNLGALNVLAEDQVQVPMSGISQLPTASVPWNPMVSFDIHGCLHACRTHAVLRPIPLYCKFNTKILGKKKGHWISVINKKYAEGHCGGKTETLNVLEGPYRAI